ncbi:MAG: EamA family transporter [Desulfobacteraceae bacterium]|nr:MAG: EamA family transporter [Desulfobacteraceae bacterium]
MFVYPSGRALFVWFVLSLLTALLVAGQDTWVKKYFSHGSVWEMTAFPLFFSFPLCIIALFFVPVPDLDASFYGSFIAGLPINFIGLLLYMKAIKVSPLSLTVPYLAFTPTFLIPVGFVFLNELPDIWGMTGILLTCAGSYVLNIDKARWSVMGPVRAMIRETGSWIMLIVAFIYSFGAVAGKISILHSSPLFFSMSFFLVFNLIMLGLLFAFRKIHLSTFRKEYKKGMIAGTLFFFQILCHSFAISMVKAAYMISIKRFSVLFGVICGKLVFQEKDITVRLAGSLMMVIGAMLIVLAGK